MGQCCRWHSVGMVGVEPEAGDQVQGCCTGWVAGNSGLDSGLQAGDSLHPQAAGGVHRWGTAAGGGEEDRMSPHCALMPTPPQLGQAISDGQVDTETCSRSLL